MSATYLHVGIPVTNKKPGMVYVDALKLWMSKPDDVDYKIEYLKFEEGTPFPEIMHKNPHIAYKVDDMDARLSEADRVIFGPVTMDDGGRMAFIIKDDTIFELLESK
ncbi:hypothetical protein LJB99_05520 [Deltaproteobacteria bacterium OttesenSCG-928-K17]|nr:hypothetical protein [Deltaproteobacteria bacterium OttesenSCG-928-K17]